MLNKFFDWLLGKLIGSISIVSLDDRMYDDLPLDKPERIVPSSSLYGPHDMGEARSIRVFLNAYKPEAIMPQTFNGENGKWADGHEPLLWEKPVAEKVRELGGFQYNGGRVQIGDKQFFDWEEVSDHFIRHGI